VASRQQSSPPASTSPQTPRCGALQTLGTAEISWSTSRRNCMRGHMSACFWLRSHVWWLLCWCARLLRCRRIACLASGLCHFTVRGHERTRESSTHAAFSHACSCRFGNMPQGSHACTRARHSETCYIEHNMAGPDDEVGTWQYSPYQVGKAVHTRRASGPKCIGGSSGPSIIANQTRTSMRAGLVHRPRCHRPQASLAGQSLRELQLRI
jgi:hypothetical protein